MDYYSYIRSPEWQVRALAAKRRAGFRCQVCNRSSVEVTLDAHHRTYERLGNEEPEDITVLCRDCHELYEKQKKLPKSPDNSSNEKLSVVPFSVPPDFVLSEARDSVGVAASADLHEWDDTAVGKHMLVRLGQFVHFFGYTCNGIYLVHGFAVSVIGNPINLINPLFYVVLPLQLLTTSLFWQFVFITAVGIGLLYLGILLVRAARPQLTMFQWYWRWKPTLFFTLPIFLISIVGGWGAVIGLFAAIVRITLGDVAPSLPLLGSNVLHLYLSLLPLPIIHLIWDSRIRQLWAKLLISVLIIPLLWIGYAFAYGLWNAVGCSEGTIVAELCDIYISPELQ